MTRLLLLSAVLLIASGCEGANSHATAPSPTRTSTTTSANERTALLRGIRTAVAANSRLSGVVLWTNSIPGTATGSTGGPALASLRSAAAGRRKQGIRIRTLSEQTVILSIKLDRSNSLATVVVRARETLAPYQAGKRLGRAVDIDERARLELHRNDHTGGFRVWNVTPIS